MSSSESIAVVVLIMGYSIGRQIAGQPLRLKRLLGLPLALTVIGAVDVVNSKGQAATDTDLALIVGGCALNVMIGIGEGRLMRLGSRDGYLWGQMPTSVLWWWAAKIASGVILEGIAAALGAHLATISAVMLLRLGANRLAQAAVVAPRALATGIPFAPEPTKDNPIAGLTGQWAQRNTSQTDDDSSASKTSGPGLSDPSSKPTPAPSPPQTDLFRQIVQALRREISDRLNDISK